MVSTVLRFTAVLVMAVCACVFYIIAYGHEPPSSPHSSSARPSSHASFHRRATPGPPASVDPKPRSSGVRGRAPPVKIAQSLPETALVKKPTQFSPAPGKTFKGGVRSHHASTRNRNMTLLRKNYTCTDPCEPAAPDTDAGAGRDALQQCTRRARAGSPVWTYNTFHNVRLLANGTLISAAPPNTTHAVPPCNGRTYHLLQMAKQVDDASSWVSLGSHGAVFVFCEYFSVTYPVWLMDCLPRFLRGYPQIQDLGPGVKVLCPGEYYAYQFLIEVMHVPEDRLVLLPTHLQWGPKYSLYHVHFDTVYHVPLPEDHLKHPEIFRDLQRAVLQNLGLELQGGRARHLEVLFSERADITMPANHTDLLEDLQRRAPHIRFRTLRFETQNVVSQVREMRAVDVLVGPPGSNLLNLLFMRRGAAVVELMPGGDVVVQRPTWAQQMASIMGLGYRSLDPEVGAERWARHRRQPVFLADSVLDAVKPLVTEFAKTSAAAFEASESMFLSPRLMGCQDLFHLRRTQTFIGWWKQTYIIPQRFALKLPRKAHWRKVAAEMLLLRNLSDSTVLPAVALCFDNPDVQFAQLLAQKTLRWEHGNAVFNNSHFFVALGGYLKMWRMHETRGRYLFYCDSNPKNWAFSKDGELKMFDFDASWFITRGTLCHEDSDCGCADLPAADNACVNHRCTDEGMRKKVDWAVRQWVKTTAQGLSPMDMRPGGNCTKGAEDLKRLVRRANKNVMVEADVIDFLREWAPQYGVSLCSLGLGQCGG